MVIVDTSVWLQALNVGTSVERREVDKLLAINEVAMVGIVMAEVLRGARNEGEFERLRLRLAEVPFLPETKETWTRVGAVAYQLKRRGLTVPLPDVLIGAIALEHGQEVYTQDEHFRRIPGLKLYAVNTR
jgi:hypothetical protein